MRISLLQDTIFWTDKKANLDKTQKQIEELSGATDLVLLPEMFSTGFCLDTPQLAEPMNGETITRLKQWSQKYRVAISGSFMAKESEQIFNRAFFICPNGEVQTADKRHLFSMSGENNVFSAGNKRLIVNYMGFNICILVCYDLRFPIWSRNVNNEYDLLVYLANWPEARITAWDALLQARAIENQAYVCGVNRIGTDTKGINFPGHSKLIDAKGLEIYAAQPDKKEIKTILLSKDELIRFREKFSAWKDADAFEIL